MYEHSRTIFTSRAAARSYVTLRCYDVSLNFVHIVLLYIFDELALNDLESKFGQLGSSTYVEKVEFLIIFEILTRLGIVKRSFTCFSSLLQRTGVLKLRAHVSAFKLPQ